MISLRHGCLVVLVPLCLWFGGCGTSGAFARGGAANPLRPLAVGATDEMSDDQCDGEVGEHAIVYKNATGKHKDATLQVANTGSCPVTIRRYGGSGPAPAGSDADDTIQAGTTTSITITVLKRDGANDVPGRLEAFCERGGDDCDFEITVIDVDDSPE